MAPKWWRTKKLCTTNHQVLTSSVHLFVAVNGEDYFGVDVCDGHDATFHDGQQSENWQKN